MKTLRAILLLLVIPLFAPAQRLTQLVDPFIGTGGDGHTFPGATMPFGMVQLSPDTRLKGWDVCGGYHYSDKTIYGFSHTHLSGTGVLDYGDILLMPTVGDVYLDAFVDGKTEKGYASPFSHQNENAQPGYYSVRLDDGSILAELTATNRGGMHRYTFSPNATANIILDLTHRDVVLDSYLRIIDDRHVEGYRRSTGWARDQIVYFVAEFSEGFTGSGIAIDDKMEPESAGGLTKRLNPSANADGTDFSANAPSLTRAAKQARGKNVKAFFNFKPGTKPIMVKVALSAVSIDGARRNLAAELPHWDFDGVKRAAAQTWEKELSRINVTGGTEAQRKNFYTALYHTMVVPNLFMDVDGQFRGLDGKSHQARGFTNYTVFSLWDTFRATHPLYTIIDQKRTADYLKTFLAHYEHGGRLPVWELAGNETDTMIGYHAIPVIADAAVKGITGFDREKAFTAMKHSADLKHFGLNAYRERGFINAEDDRESVSKTLEYAYDDWCIAEMARLLGRTDDYRRFTKRAQSYRNVIDVETGFARPRKNGGWLSPFDPREVNFNFTEANSWQYTFFVPQDVSGLMEWMGGREKFARKLDELFTTDSKTTGRELADITGLIGQYAHGNEPSHHMAYLYNYAGQPWKTQQRVRQILDRFYSPAPNGLIGNEDCGQMSAWYVLSAAGFYPVTPGQPMYAIGTPLFPELRFNLENGRTFVIKARGVSAQNIYIQSAVLNRKPYHRSYLMHRDLMAGGELVFQMGPQPNVNWGSLASDVPVAAITANKIVPPPIIEAASKTFREYLEVTIKPGTKGPRLHFTIDGTEPTVSSPAYEKPITIKDTTSVKAVAINSQGEKSQVTTAALNKISNNWRVRILSRYSSQYTGDGDEALIDGLRGNGNFHVSWQGYWRQDFAAVVDLGKVQEVRKLGAGFLQDVQSWIWMPRRVEFETSTDGEAFIPVASIRNEVSDKQYGAIVRDFVTRIAPQRARFVRIKALTYGPVPDWHPGYGGHAWIFIDEIVIE